VECVPFTVAERADNGATGRLVILDPLVASTTLLNSFPTMVTSQDVDADSESGSVSLLTANSAEVPAANIATRQNMSNHSKILRALIMYTGPIEY
jgi:hypothetical protein